MNASNNQLNKEECTVKRLVTALICFALILSLGACGTAEKQKPAAEAQSYSDVYAAIDEALKCNDVEVWNGIRYVNAGIAKAVDDSVEAAPAHSDTNVQVEGIDEGDIAKTDGRYIYAVFDDELRIYKADGKNTDLVSTTKIEAENCWVHEMYLAGDKLIIVAGEATVCFDYALRENDGAECKYTPPKTKLLIYDVINPEKPNYVNCCAQDGEYKNSRMLDGCIYLVSSYWVGGDIKKDKPETYVPCTYCGNTAKLISAGDICIMPDRNSNAYTVAAKFDIESGESDSMSVLGACDNLYMSSTSLYLASSKYVDEESKPYEKDGYTVTDVCSRRETELCRVDLASMNAAATAKVPGGLESQFSMDEYKGNLRLVTTSQISRWSNFTDKKYDFENVKLGEDSSSTGLYILDGKLRQLAAVENLAKDEYVRSVRFDGDFVYFCTFRQTDPLFAVNVADPSKPEILSEYKISGFSEYLHPWGEGLLFGLGMEADEATGRTEGLKLVMFDISDKADVKALHTAKLDRDYSEALYNHHALMISPEKGIIGFGTDNAFEIYGYSAEKGFSRLAKVALDNDWGDSRGMYIGDFAYILSEAGLTVLDMQSFEMIAEI